MFQLTQRRGSGASSAVLAATAALVVALTVAGCSDSGDGGTDGSTVETTAAMSTDSGPADVPDVTHLILETALGNLTLLGLETEVVDESGAPVTVDDATAYTVEEQDPAAGETLDAGATVTLTVAPRG